MNERIKHLKAQLFAEPREISLERALLYTESYKQTAGEPTIIRRAKAMAHILEQVQISIRTEELIAGNRTIKPRSGIISPEMDPYWILTELDTLYTRPQDQFYISEADKQIYWEQLYPYWQNNSMKDFINTRIPEEVKTAIAADIFTLNQTDKGQGHIIMDFPTVLSQGLAPLLQRVRETARQYGDNEFYKAAIIVLEAAQKHILRYYAMALQNAAVEKNPQRKNELLKIAVIAKKLSTNKPECFYEACQLLWYISIIAQYESNASSLSLGRFDQYMYDFYQQDITKGVSRNFLKEVLECFWIKTNDVVLLRSTSSAKYFAGFPTGYTVTLGGWNTIGHSAVNELSYLCLETYHDIQLPQPNLAVRLNEFIPRSFLNATVETIRLGTGIPQIFNDEVIVPAFLNRGVSLEDARDYAIVGCVELSIPGKTYGLHDIALFNLLKIMELSLHQNKDKEPSFSDIITDVKQGIVRYVQLVTEASNTVDLGHREFAPVPFLSCLIDDCLKKGLDITQGGAHYNFSGIQGIGEANLSDSLYALKKVVFEERRITFAELIQALETNFEGPEYSELRIRLINQYDKYGNDNDELDFIAADILRYYAKELELYPHVREGKFTPGAYTVSAHIPLGAAVGATPDGRKAREQLADGGLSPMVGRDRLGPTAVLKSVSKLDNYLLSNGSLLNVKFSPQTLAGTAGIKKFSDFLMAFMRLKIQHIQFNVISRETLLAAQEKPQEHKGLVVRVAGYSAFFIELNKEIQDDIIARTEHVL